MADYNLKWSFYQIWNQSLEEGKSDRILQPREKIWASELGGCYVDRYLKMQGIEPSNPPNPRSLRKFEAGNIWESIVGYVLLRAGLLQKRQEWIQFQYPTLFPVSGKLDFIAGGNPDCSKAVNTIKTEFDWLPEFISRATINIVQSLTKKYPDGLENIILEIKSCSSFMFEKYEKMNEPQLQHKLQLFHYLKSKNMPEGHIVYVSKDDARLLEFGVFNPSPVEEEYRKDIETITNYCLKGEQPPLERPLVLEDDFSANWKVGYSNYLTRLYGIKTQKDFDDMYKPMAERWNRVLGRIREGKEMTANNIEALKEISDWGFDISHIKPEKKGATNADVSK